MARENKIRIKFVVNDDQAKKDLREMSSRLEEVGGKITQLGGFMTAAFTVPIAGAFAAAVTQSEELQAALSPIKEEFAGIAATFGDAIVPVIEDLMPDIKRLIGFVGDLVGKFAELDTDSKKRILGFAAAIAAIGPALAVVGQLTQLVGVVGNITAALGGGVSIGAGGAAAGGAAAAAGGGATAAVSGFGAALTTVVAPLAAVLALAFGLWKILEKIGATKAAGQTLKDLGGILRYGFANLMTGGDTSRLDPEKFGAWVQGGTGALGFANGVSNFVVPQGFPNDSFMVGLTSGETVNVTPAGQRGGSGGTININIYSAISTPKDIANQLKPALQIARRDLGWA